jgi:NDP-sugar pyrophosphorylase family protein
VRLTIYGPLPTFGPNVRTSRGGRITKFRVKGCRGVMAVSPSSYTAGIGIILAGQHSWSDSTFDAFPRPLLPIANRPLASYAAEWLYEGGIREVAVCANRETRTVGEGLWHHIPDGLQLTLREDEDHVPRGPAGCVRDAAAGYEGPVVVVDGTTIPLADLRELLASHQLSGAALTVVVRPEPGGGRRHEPCGIYVFERRALDYVPSRGYCDIKESLIPRLHRAGERTLAHPIREASPRALDGPSYLALNEWMVERLAAGPPPEGYVQRSGLLAHQSARIASDTVLLGPLLVGPGAQLMPGATLVGPASIGARSIVKARALVSRTAVWSDCVVGEGAVADRSIVADRSVIAPRTRVTGCVPSPARKPASARSRPMKPWLDRLLPQPRHSVERS